MAGMNFNTSNETFRQLMANGLSYRVPPFQRDYSWTAVEWDDLWRDIEGLFGEDAEPAHYMGYLVLQSSDNKRFDIIDGQQRMTTLSALILASVYLLENGSGSDKEKEKNLKRAEQLRNGYIGYLNPVTLIPDSKIHLNRHNDSFYQNYLVPLNRIPQRGLSGSEHLLRKAFAWFKDHLKAYADENGERLASLIDTIVDKLFFTVITVTDELNAFKVFETLNARGVRLSSTDLLKNYLFSLVHREGAHEIEMENLEDRWEKIVGLLSSESFPEFLRVFWNSRHKLVRKAELFKTIRKKITNKAEAFSLIRDLDECAGVYAALRNPLDEIWNAKERRNVKELRMFNVRQPMALLLACFRRFFEDDRDAFYKILRSVSVVSFRYNVICNMQTNEQERVYNDIAVRIASEELKTAREIIESLKRVYPEDKQFKAAFREKELRTTSSRNKKVVRYMLNEMEKRISCRPNDLESDVYGVEHILPERPEKGWEEFDEASHDDFVYRIGNMTLLDSTANRKLGNAEYGEKKDAYAQSEFEITRMIAKEYSEWNPDKINSRQDWMSRQATAIWRLNL